ncbi:hypothetical protein [Nonomuraea sp. B1E8]|uniref:hypothetical protein n=1 Tax=unclassified Nonomuraea TaxID=2593643 RepID=UPI00325DE3DF
MTDERARKGSLEQRGIAVISTSGTLIAITLGFITLGTKNPSVALPPTLPPLLMAALAGLVAACAAGLLINVPAKIPIIDATDLAESAARADWDATDRESAQVEQKIQAQVLVGLRKANRLRARVLLVALLFEVVSLMIMAITVGFAFWPML